MPRLSVKKYKGLSELLKGLSNIIIISLLKGLSLENLVGLLVGTFNELYVIEIFMRLSARKFPKLSAHQKIFIIIKLEILIVFSERLIGLSIKKLIGLFIGIFKGCQNTCWSYKSFMGLSDFLMQLSSMLMG